MALSNDEIGAKLSLKDRRHFSAEAEAAVRDIRKVGDASEKAGKKGRLSAAGFGVMKKGIQGIAKVAKLGIVGLGGLAAAVGIMGAKEVMDAQKVTAQTNAVLTSTHRISGMTQQSVDNLAKSIMGYSGMDDEAVKSGENLLLTFTNIRNGVGKGNDVFNRATGSIVDMSTAMHEDLRSSAIRVGKALQDPIKGATALRRVGVMLTDQQQEQIKTFVKSGKMMEAQKIILGELNTEFGGSAKAYGKTLPGLLARTKETAKNLAGDIMRPLLDLAQGPLDSLLKWANTFGDKIPLLRVYVRNFFDAMLGPGGKLVPVIDGIKNAAIGFWNILRDDLIPVAKDLWTIFTVALLPTLKDIAKWAIPIWVGFIVVQFKVIARVIKTLAQHATVLRPIIVGLVAAFVTFKTIMFVINMIKAIRTSMIAMNAAMMANPVVLIIAAIVGLAVALVYAYKKSETFRNIVNAVFRTVKNVIMGVYNWVKTNWPYLLAILTGPIGLAVLAINKNWDKIKGAVTGVKNWIVNAWNTVVSFVTGLPGRITRAVSGMWNGIKEGFKHAVNWVIRKWNDLSFTIGGQKVFGHKLPGVTFGTPNIPLLHEGGTVKTGGLVNMRPDEEIVYMPPAATVVPLEGQAGADGRTGHREPQVIQLVVDRKKLAEVVVDGVRDRAARR